MTVYELFQVRLQVLTDLHDTLPSGPAKTAVYAKLLQLQHIQKVAAELYHLRNPYATTKGWEDLDCDIHDYYIGLASQSLALYGSA